MGFIQQCNLLMLNCYQKSYIFILDSEIGEITNQFLSQIFDIHIRNSTANFFLLFCLAHILINTTEVL